MELGFVVERFVLRVLVKERQESSLGYITVGHLRHVLAGMRTRGYPVNFTEYPRVLMPANTCRRWPTVMYPNEDSWRSLTSTRSTKRSTTKPSSIPMTLEHGWS